MTFISLDFFIFLVLVLGIYWTIRHWRHQNIFLLGASYLFYGWIHPWFSLLLLTQSAVDYGGALGMKAFPTKKGSFLAVSLICNLGVLGLFKYFNFFAENVAGVLAMMGLHSQMGTLHWLLPVGISFYTFETMSYSIDVYRGILVPRTNFIDYSLFVAFFPHLVAGPIQRAPQFLPQLESRRSFKWSVFGEAWPLIVRGYVEKLIIADNVAVYANQVFMLKQPSWPLLLAGTLAFALQIYADFLGYTDIARGVSLLFGLRLSQNFNSPYLAISPSDFWRRWHITFSSWIRDYLYIPLGGSRVHSAWAFAGVIFVTMALSGLWHGAQWHFVVWGMYHGGLLWVYHRLGMGGRWQPRGSFRTGIAWCAMMVFVLFGWLLFRAPSLAWIRQSIRNSFVGPDQDSSVASAIIMAFVAFYSTPLLVWKFLDRRQQSSDWLHPVIYGLAVIAILVFAPEKGQDFIYFHF